MTSAAEERAAAEATARIVAWIDTEARNTMTLANAESAAGRASRAAGLTLASIALSDAADAIEAGAHLAAPQEGK